MKIIFKKPYLFEKQEYTEVSLDLEKISAEDMIRAQAAAQGHGEISPVAEFGMAYCLHLAAAASGKPVEFFFGLPGRDAAKVRIQVSNFFMSEE